MKRWSKYLIIGVMAVIFCTASISSASDCRVEEWTWTMLSGYLKIDGATTCESGDMYVRIYTDDKYIGNDFAFIEGYTFTLLVPNVPRPTTVAIKYVIKAE